MVLVSDGKSAFVELDGIGKSKDACIGIKHFAFGDELHGFEIENDEGQFPLVIR